MGLNVEKMINGDSLEFGLRLCITERASELKRDLDDNLAVAIVNRLGESLEKGRSR